MTYKRRRITYFAILIFILLIPIVLKSNLILFGGRIEGEVVKHGIIKKGGHRPYWYKVLKIEFNAKDEIIQFWIPTFIRYPLGKGIKVIYEKGNPTNCMVSKYYLLYTENYMIVLIFLLIVWISIYPFFKEKKQVDK